MTKHNRRHGQEHICSPCQRRLKGRTSPPWSSLPGYLHYTFSSSFLSPHLLWCGSFLLLFCGAFSPHLPVCFSFLIFFYFFSLSPLSYSPTQPLLLPYSTPSIYFSKKVEKGTQPHKKKRNKRNKSRCGRKEEDTGDEKGFST